MVVNISLDDFTVAIMEHYGSISQVTDRILKLGANGSIPLIDLPSVEIPKSSCKQYKINIVDENYLSLCETYGIKSTRISLRRIIYWFIENEQYELFEWKPETNRVSPDNQRIMDLTGEIEAKLYSLYKLLNNNKHAIVIKNEIQKIKQEVWDA